MITFGGYILDVLIPVLLLYAVYRIFFRPFRQNLLALLGIVSAMTASALVFRGLPALHGILPANLLGKSAILFGIPLLVFGLVWSLFQRYVLPALTTRTGSGPPHILRKKDYAGNAVLLMTVLLFYALLFDFTLQLLQFTPQGETVIRESVLLRLGQRVQTSLIVEEEPESSNQVKGGTLREDTSSIAAPGTGASFPSWEGQGVGKSVGGNRNARTHPQPLPGGEFDGFASETERKTVPASLLKAQKTALQALRKNVGEARDFLADKSGSRQLIEFMELTKTLAELSDEEKIWLFEVTPELQAIAENDSLKAIFHDEELLTTILEASEGSVRDLYALSEHKAIQALFDDRELLDLVRQVQLAELLRKVRERRKAREDVKH